MKKNYKIIYNIQAILALIILVISTTLCFIPIFFIGLIKFIPIKRVKLNASKIIDSIAKVWCDVNNTAINLLMKKNLHVQNNLPMNQNESCYLIANHQSGCDIILLHWLFNRKIPVLRFFIKDQLKWIPLLGYCWWAMGFPFMKRYSKDYLMRNPHKKLRDQKAAQKSIAHFQNLPTTITTFIEGTRFTQKKHQIQQSKFEHLLKPKSGGISYAMSAMDKRINKIIDVTIVYSKKNPSLWDFLTRRIDKIMLHVREINIPEHFLDDALVYNEQKLAEFRQWLNTQWHEKDELIMTLKNECVV